MPNLGTPLYSAESLPVPASRQAGADRAGRGVPKLFL